MYVIFNAADVVEESYLALVSQESESATGLAAVTQNLHQPPPPTLPYHPQQQTSLHHHHHPQHQQLPNGRAAPAGIATAPAVYHDTRPEQQRAQDLISRVCTTQFVQDPLEGGKSLTQLQPGEAEEKTNDAFYCGGDDAAEVEAEGLPDLVSAAYVSLYGFDKHPGNYRQTLVLKKMSKLPVTPGIQGGGGRGVAEAAGGAGDLPPPPSLKFPDLIHPSQNEPLKSHQQATFRLVKTVSDFTHALSKAHEQHAEDLQNLTDDFRRKSAEFRDRSYSDRSTLWTAWDGLLHETEADAASHADVAGVISRAVSRPLLEKTFHMKIQSRKVFAHRESYETILAKTEEMLLKCYDDYCMAVEVHSVQASPTTYANLVESHNDYVQQLHAANGMVDQYYAETLPLLLQELDDVYHDVSAVVAETLIQGSDVMAVKTAEVARRYESLARVAKNINPPLDLNHFVKTLHIPESMTVSKHKYALPQPREPIQMDKFAFLRDEVLVDRATQNSARARFDNLTKEASELDLQTRQLTESLDKLVRIQARSIESALFNKANELQEDISLKRFDQRIAHLHLAAVNAQKEMFASKVDGGSGSTTAIGTGHGVTGNGGAIGGGGGGGGGGSGGSWTGLVGAGGGGGGGPPSVTGGVNMGNANERERKMSTSSTGSMKNKWVKAFKSIKVVGGPKDSVEEQRKNSGSGNGSPAMDAHIFQEYTYKKITPCDICSQILRGHTRQGLKCKLCRMNVHPDCQDQVPKCQPKSRLLRRQRSTSELESVRPLDTEDDSGFLLEDQLHGLPPSGAGANARRHQFQLKSLSIDSQKSSASSRASESGGPPPLHPFHTHKPVGGSYSASSGASMQALTGKPKLAEVAAALLKAKREGQLPSAFGDITLPGTQLPSCPENPEGGATAPNGNATAPAPGGGGQADPPPLNLNPAVKNKFMAAAQQIKAQQQTQSQPQPSRSLQPSS